MGKRRDNNGIFYKAWLESRDEPTEEFKQECLLLAKRSVDYHIKYLTVDESDRECIIGNVFDIIMKFKDKFLKRNKDGKGIWLYYNNIARSAAINIIYKKYKSQFRVESKSF